MQRVLITCPPMLKEVEQINELAAQHSLELVPTNVVQTLSEQELQELLPQYDGWIAGDDPGTEAVFDAAVEGNLKAVIKWGIGVDNIDADAIAKHGLPFANTPGMFSDEVADLGLGYLLALVRHIVTIDREVRAGNWIKPQGTSLRGKRAAIVGMGNIGQALATRLQACGLEVQGYDPFVTAVDGVKMLDWPTQVEAADYLFLCCALTESNFHLINADIFGQLKPSSIVVNVSRGPLIQEAALIQALQNNEIAGAALDVFEVEPVPLDSPILKHPRVIVGSHNASNTTEAVRATNAEAVRLIADMLNG